MSSSSQQVESWISSFCSLLGHEFFAEVSEDFIEDDFNMTGLSSQVPMYKEALEMILDVEPEDDEEEDEEDEDEDDDLELDTDVRSRFLADRQMDRRQARWQNNMRVVEESAELLYGLIHQRYITSRQGLTQMHEKYEQSHFGFCPRVYCRGARVLAVGISDVPGQETVKLFCPSCLDVYTPPNSRFQTVDGAFFGMTFGCLFLMSFPETHVGSLQPLTSPSPSGIADDTNSLGSRGSHLSPTSTQSTAVSRRPNNRSDIPQPAEINGATTSNFAPGLGTGNIYEPRIYGFKINERAKSGPRMKWLRMKPDNIRELDEVRRYEILQASTLQEQNYVDVEALDEDNVEDNADEGDGISAGYSGANGSSQQAQRMEIDAAIEQRKKAPMRKRARRTEEQNAGTPKPIDANGFGNQR